MTTTHKCDACGGTGAPTSSNTVYRDGHTYRCVVCLGAGSFPDQMPVADALADAETLELAWRDKHGFRPTIFASTLQTASRGAHAAFRAVPGLQG